MQGECNDTPLLLYLAAMYSVWHKIVKHNDFTT